jgi:hypothetical protein
MTRMCLQWCHVTQQIVHNDHPCFHCPSFIRFAKTNEDCSTCAHFRGQTCALTRVLIPAQRNCCHHNVKVTEPGPLRLTSKNIDPIQLIFHQVSDIEQLFWLVESAPEPKVIRRGVIEVQLDDLALPFVYGLPADEWR